MTRAVVFLLATLLAASLGVVAEDNSTPEQSSSPATQSSTDNSAQRTVTITGCLAAPSSGSSYILTDASGIAFTLAGNTTALQGHTGQEIQVTGQHGVGANASTNASESAGSNPSDTIRGKSADGGTIQVTESKIVSDHCRPTGDPQPNSGSGGGAASGGTAANDTAQTATTARTNVSVEPSASDEDTRSAPTDAQLPQTSTFLPLLGLIGLGSLVAGFFARR